MIKFYVYRKDSGLLVSEYVGSPSEAVDDIPDDCDFTLSEPTNYRQPWYWVDTAWTTEQPS